MLPDVFRIRKVRNLIFGTALLFKVLLMGKGKVKVKLSLCFNWVPHREDVLGSGGIAPHIL
jgi:hypothetical protein